MQEDVYRFQILRSIKGMNSISSLSSLSLYKYTKNSVYQHCFSLLILRIFKTGNHQPWIGLELIYNAYSVWEAVGWINRFVSSTCLKFNLRQSESCPTFPVVGI
jgi:hypothetical protein